MEQLLIQFRAGRINKEGTRCVPDNKKGLLRIIKTEDTLVHVQWCERNASGDAVGLEADFIVFPNEVKVEHLAPHRSVLIKFPEDPTRDVLYWFQEPKSSAFDAKRAVEKMNAVLNIAELDEMSAEALAAEEGNEMAGITPTSALEHAHLSLSRSAGSEVGGGPSIGMYPQAPGQLPTAASDLSSASALAALLGNAVVAGVGGLPRTPENIDEEVAQELLKQLSASRRGAQGPLLHHVLTREVLSPLFRDPELLRRLTHHLPEDQRDAAAFASLVSSPQFRQQLAALATALASGELDPQQFGLPAGTGFTAEAFLQAIQDEVDREKAKAPKEDDENGGGSESGSGSGSGSGSASSSKGGPAPMEQ